MYGWGAMEIRKSDALKICPPLDNRALRFCPPDILPPPQFALFPPPPAPTHK